jgi:peptidase M28-like protein
MIQGWKIMRINSRAPGADDNASGVAVILEIARLISNLKLEKTVQLVFFQARSKVFGDQNTTLES